VASETILVVDDGEENREFVDEYILKPNGYESLLARDGREGLQLAVEHQPDLMLLDLQMPRMNGREVLMALAERGIDIPVVLMTFHGSEEIAIEMHRMGVKDYVKKPYSVDEMLHVIERSLSESRLIKEKNALMERVLKANRELQQRVQELNILYKVGKTVASTADMTTLLPQIVDAATQITGAEEGRLYLMESEKLVCRAEKHANRNRTDLTERETRNPAALHVIERGKELIVTREQFGDYPNSPNSAAYAPLVLRDAVIGVLGVSNVAEDSKVFSKNDLALLSALTDYAAIAIGNSRSFDSIKAERTQIRGTFERFVAPTVVQRVLENPDDLQLGGHRQQVTILFADIRGYTAWSENEEPERVVEMLNDYLSLAAELVLGWEGTLDKFFGDGLMAIFNAPEPQEQHVHRAVDTAIALLKAAEELNQRKGYGLNYSIGVNTGEAVVGYIGTDRALNYTAIGDTVNLAKRIQEKAAPAQILIEEAVFNQIGSLLEAKKLGELKIRNRKQPAAVYEVLGLAPLQ
jgi:adenylate cyclase